MPMRLLPRQEINLRQAEQKRAEIEEGLKLARRIDNLREIVAQEEASLASFRSATIKSLQEEIKTLENQRDRVKKEANDLKKHLDNTVNQLLQRKKCLDDRETSLNSLESNLEKRFLDLKKLAEKLRNQAEVYSQSITLKD